MSDVVSCLTSVPVSDSNWRGAADKATLEELQQVLKMLQNINNENGAYKTKIVAIEREIRKRNKKEDNSDMDKTLNFFDMLGLDSGEVKKEVKNTTAAANVKTTKKTPTKVETLKEEIFEGVRHVVVYGQELFTVEDPKVTMEDIRQRIVTEFLFPEFSKERTSMSLDKETGIVVPVISFQKKG